VKGKVSRKRKNCQSQTAEIIVPPESLSVRKTSRVEATDGEPNTSNIPPEIFPSLFKAQIELFFLRNKNLRIILYNL
jgi:hypothetical protein